MMKLTLSSYKLTPHAFMVLCILGGTDFVDKKPLLTMIGPERLLTALSTYSMARSSLDQFGRHTEVDDMHSLMVFLYSVYAGPVKSFPVLGMYCYDVPDDIDPATQTKRIMKWGTFLSAISLRLTRSYKPPTEAVIKQQRSVLLWNLRYWQELVEPLAPAAGSGTTDTSKRTLSASEAESQPAIKKIKSV